MNIRKNEDPFAKNVHGFSKIYHEVGLLKKFSQTKPQIKIMNFNYYDLNYTVIKNRDEKKILDDQCENDFINFTDIIPNHYVGRKNNIEILT